MYRCIAFNCFGGERYLADSLRQKGSPECTFLLLANEDTAPGRGRIPLDLLVTGGSKCRKERLKTHV